ncbi:cutinase, partial [Microdochium bolleyi]
SDLEKGDSASCPDAIFIFARATFEPGTLGITTGPIVAHKLRESLNVWVQGVGGRYAASVGPNFLPEGTDSTSIDEALRLFNLANSKCPDTPVVAGGYRPYADSLMSFTNSQGTAVMAGALRRASSAVAEQVKGVVLFGYTKNQQYGGVIPNFPPDKVAVYCGTFDAVCFGTLFILPDHVFYFDEAAHEAPAFLLGKIA